MWFGIWQSHRGADSAEAAVFMSRLASPVRYLGCQISLWLFFQASTPSCTSVGVGHSVFFFFAFFLPSLLPWGHQQVCFLISAQGVCFEDNFSPFSYRRNVRNEAPWPQPTAQPGCACARRGGRARGLQAGSRVGACCWVGSDREMAPACAGGGMDFECISEHFTALKNTRW